MKGFPKTLLAFIAVMALISSLSCSNAQTPTPGAAVSPTRQVTSAAPGRTPSPSGYVSKVTMAKDTQGDTKDPVNPTTTFSPSDTFHAVAALSNAPANTVVKASWYTVDVGDVAAPNTLIASYPTTTGGTRNIDFGLTPSMTSTKWPVWPLGTYRVEIDVNDILDQVVSFIVK